MCQATGWCVRTIGEDRFWVLMLNLLAIIITGYIV
jgi:hypothetical protein